jgi:hypothetical protein
MTLRRFLLLGALAAAAVCRRASSLRGTGRRPPSSPDTAAVFSRTAKAFFTQYCATCPTIREIADVVLDTRDYDHVGADPDLWGASLRK